MEDLSGKDDFVNQEETMGRTRVAGFTLLEQKTPKGKGERRLEMKPCSDQEEFAALESCHTHPCLYSVHNPRRAQGVSRKPSFLSATSGSPTRM